MAVKITSVEPGSPARRARIHKGDTLISINGNPITDVLDYQFYTTDEHLEILLCDEEKKVRTVLVEKDEYDDLGLQFETYLMDKQMGCRNPDRGIIAESPVYDIFVAPVRHPRNGMHFGESVALLIVLEVLERPHVFHRPAPLLRGSYAEQVVPDGGLPPASFERGLRGHEERVQPGFLAGGRDVRPVGFLKFFRCHSCSSVSS